MSSAFPQQRFCCRCVPELQDFSPERRVLGFQEFDPGLQAAQQILWPPPCLRKPLVEFAGLSNHRCAQASRWPVHRKPEPLPTLYCAHATAHVIGNFFPAVEDQLWLRTGASIVHTARDAPDANSVGLYRALGMSEHFSDLVRHVSGKLHTSKKGPSFRPGPLASIRYFNFAAAFTPTSCTSMIKVALGGITGGAPLEPYAADGGMRS